MGLKITGVKFIQHDTHFIIGYAKAGGILRQIRVDEWSIANPKGYQRRAIERRAREFGNFIAKNGISPSAVLLNIRDIDINDIHKINENEFEVPAGINLWIVDGQHRLKGLELVSMKYPDVLEINIPVIILNLQSTDPDLTRKQEATQFLIINKTQKGVRSDLAERILAQEEVKKEQHENLDIPTFLRRNSKLEIDKNEVIKEKSEYLYSKPYNMSMPPIYKDNLKAIDKESSHINFNQSVLPSNLRRELRWKPRAVHIADLLNNRLDSPLQGKMKLPNSRPRGTTFSQVSMVGSLKNVLSTAPFSSLSEDEIASVLINMWKAVKELCPEPFQEVERKQRADDYVLLKTTGIFVIPKILIGINSYMPHDNERHIYTMEVFESFLSRAGRLMEAGFWRSAGPGTAGSYGTGQKSFSYIAQQIIKRIIMKGDDRGKQNVIL